MPISNMDHVPAQEADQPDQNTAERQQRPRLQWQSAARQQEAPCNFQASRVRATSRHRPGYVGSASLLACTSKVHASFVPSRKTVCHLHGSDSIHLILGLRNTHLQIFTSGVQQQFLSAPKHFINHFPRNRCRRASSHLSWPTRTRSMSRISATSFWRLSRMLTTSLCSRVCGAPASPSVSFQVSYPSIAISSQRLLYLVIHESVSTCVGAALGLLGRIILLTQSPAND